jgi:Asp-tRNA(Asn)/Glu-tRNA(Gln) amidotransferase A subunit family amidase
MPTTAGTKALSDNYPKENAPAVQNIIDSGGIIIGKANMSEFALSAYNSYSSYGDVKNAYNLNYSSYGSSGGTAVGIASNFAVAGLGTDTGGSVRLPSAANNLVGLRPTYGSVSGDGVIKLDKTRDIIGPITKYVEDNAILMDIISKDKTNFEKALNKRETLKGVKIGVATQFMNLSSKTTGIATSTIDYDIYQKMQNAITNFKNLGAEIIYINDFYDGYYSFNDTSFCYDFNQYLKDNR